MNGLAVIITVIVVIIFLLAYVYFAKNEVKKNKRVQTDIKRFGDYLKQNVDSIEELPLLGIAGDSNSDKRFSQAVEKIVLPDDIRVKLYE